MNRLPWRNPYLCT